MLSALNALRNLDLQRDLNSSTRTTPLSPTPLSLASNLNSSSGDSTSTLSKDTVHLLRNLAKGNITAAKSDLARLQKDLKSEGAGEDTALNKLLTTISKSLDAGSAGDALSSLASYLIQTGNTNGSLLDISA